MQRCALARQHRLPARWAFHMDDDNSYPSYNTIRANQEITEEAKTWSKGPRFLWGAYLAIGAVAMLVGTIGHIPSTGPYGSPEMIVSILRNILGI
jgi:hypothetical protein